MKRGASKKPAGPAAKMSKPLQPEGLLRGQRVLLLPIGPDVSRKRLEIWQKMVEKLGGSVTQSDGKISSRKKNAIDWSDVDVVIASAELTATTAAQLLQMDTFPPDDVEIYTPEWLVYILREKESPPGKTNLRWSRQREAWERQDTKLKQTVDQDADSSDENVNSENLIPAASASVESEQSRQQQQELNAKRVQLMQERTPIFYKNNPGFKPISELTPLGSKPVTAQSFICQRSLAVLQNLNAHLTDPLEATTEFLAVKRDIWRQYMYKKVVLSLKSLRFRVSSPKDLNGLYWAKGRMRDKAVEILESGRLNKLEVVKKNNRLCALVDISRIWGVGPATATKLYSMGYKTLDALRKPEATAVLTARQHIGLKYYQDFLTKIPRGEAQQIEKTVADAVHQLIPNAHVLACGSYRRGKPACGDCDVLITDPDNDTCDILPRLLERLHASGFLTDDLTHFSKLHTGGSDTYMGVCQLSKDLPHRRLDIKVYPRRCFGLAILYFTGSDHFNRSMRLIANKYGWSLSDRELTRFKRVNGVKVKQGESVVCESEVDVFIALGLEYKDPTERNCFDIKFLDEDAARAHKEAKDE